MERVSEGKQGQARVACSSALPTARGQVSPWVEGASVLRPTSNKGGVDSLGKQIAWSQGQSRPWYLKGGVPGAPRDTRVHRKTFYLMAW